MPLVVIFLIGFGVGFVAHRYAFCVFGALVEFLSLGMPQRVLAVIAAMLVFALVHFGGYRHAIEYPGALFLVGGFIQGVGYYLASACPLGLLVRIGEGSKSHLVVFFGFIAGVAIYVGFLEGPVSALLGPVSADQTVTLGDTLLRLAEFFQR